MSLNQESVTETVEYCFRCKTMSNLKITKTVLPPKMSINQKGGKKAMVRISKTYSCNTCNLFIRSEIVEEESPTKVL